MKKAFTLIELLVVVLIIGILSAVALPQYQKAVYKSRMKEVEILLTALHHARTVYKLETGTTIPPSFDALSISLPNSCTPQPLADGEPNANCGKYNIYLGSWTTLATVADMGSCSYCHFDKLYPSGQWRCREGNVNSDFYKYCQSMGYSIVAP